MHIRKLFLAVAAVAAFGACGDDDDPTAPRPEVFSATLNSANEVPTASAPAFPSNATGTATITIQGNTVSWTIVTTGFGAGTTGPGGAAPPAHIHRGAAGTNGDVIVTLSAAINGTASGSTTVTDAILTEVRTTPVYVNVHTNNRSAGEIRGQLVKTQ